jgi:hypothetical protein
MKKTLISLFLSFAIVCSTFIGVFATNDTDPHIIKKEPPIMVIMSNDTDPH